jgi:hypothetical protein
MAIDPSKADREPAASDLARRQMIKSAIASVPIVLTVTAGTARANEGTGSQDPSQQALQGQDEDLPGEEESLPGESEPMP